MNGNVCEECGAREDLFTCAGCGQSLCELCYGDKQLPMCFECLAAEETSGEDRQRIGRPADEVPSFRRSGGSRGRRGKPRRGGRARF